jgi:hypothetical protein
VLEVRAKDLEMMSPPFVRVLRPRFKFHTGHVTIGGSICSPILTQQWDPSISLDGLGKTRLSPRMTSSWPPNPGPLPLSALYLQIGCIVDGGGRIDFGSCYHPFPYTDYSLMEAERAFYRVAR